MPESALVLDHELPDALSALVLDHELPDALSALALDHEHPRDVGARGRLGCLGELFVPMIREAPWDIALLA